MEREGPVSKGKQPSPLAKDLELKFSVEGMLKI